MLTRRPTVGATGIQDQERYSVQKTNSWIWTLESGCLVNEGSSRWVKVCIWPCDGGSGKHLVRLKLGWVGMDFLRGITAMWMMWNYIPEEGKTHWGLGASCWVKWLSTRKHACPQRPCKAIRRQETDIYTYAKQLERIMSVHTFND